MKFTDKSPIPDWETLLKSRDFVKAISEMQILREISQNFLSRSQTNST